MSTKLLALVVRHRVADLHLAVVHALSQHHENIKMCWTPIIPLRIKIMNNFDEDTNTVGRSGEDDP